MFSVTLIFWGGNSFPGVVTVPQSIMMALPLAASTSCLTYSQLESRKMQHQSQVSGEPFITLHNSSLLQIPLFLVSEHIKLFTKKFCWHSFMLTHKDHFKSTFLDLTAGAIPAATLSHHPVPRCSLVLLVTTASIQRRNVASPWAQLKSSLCYAVDRSREMFIWYSLLSSHGFSQYSVFGMGERYRALAMLEWETRVAYPILCAGGSCAPL